MTHEFANAARLTARRVSNCAICGNRIQTGDPIYWNGDAFKGAHVGCVNRPQPIAQPSPTYNPTTDTVTIVERRYRLIGNGTWEPLPEVELATGHELDAHCVNAVAERHQKRVSQGFRYNFDVSLNSGEVRKFLGETPNGAKSEIVWLRPIIPTPNPTHPTPTPIKPLPPTQEELDAMDWRDNPWMPGHLAGELAFSNRREARATTEGEFSRCSPPEVCVDCGELTWVKPTVGTHICPSCGNVGNWRRGSTKDAVARDIAAKNEHARVEREQEAAAFMSDPDFLEYMETVAESQDPFRAIPDHPSHNTDAITATGDIQSAIHEGDARARRKSPSPRIRGRLSHSMIANRNGKHDSGVRARIDGYDPANDKANPSGSNYASAATDFTNRAWSSRLDGEQTLAEAAGMDLSQEDARQPARTDTSPSTVPETPSRGAVASGIVPTKGYYTVQFTDGSHRTIKVREPRDTRPFKPDCTLLSYLSGPNNDADYTPFGHITPDGRLYLWKRFADNTKVADAAKVLMSDPTACREAYALASGCCSRCNRTLTVPASIHRGLGPECANKVMG